MTDLYKKSASELAALIRRRDASSREVVQAHLDRIEHECRKKKGDPKFILSY